MFSQPYSCETNAASSFEVFYVIYFIFFFSVPLFFSLLRQPLWKHHMCACLRQGPLSSAAVTVLRWDRLIPHCPKTKKSRLKAGDKQVRKAAEGDRNIKAQKRWEGRREMKMEGSKQKGSESEDLRKRGRESACVFVCECVCVCVFVCVCLHLNCCVHISLALPSSAEGNKMMIGIWSI